MSKLDPSLPDQIRRFLDQLEPLGVYADFQGSLNIKWEPPSGKPINLAYIKRNGSVWTDAVNWSAPKDLSHRYNEDVAAALGGYVDKTTFQGDNWHVRIVGKAPRSTKSLIGWIFGRT